MPEANTKITDQNLREKLLSSLLPDEQKNQYADLIPQMNDNERAQLLKIIGDLEGGKAKFEEEKQDRLIKLNEEYESESAAAAREESKYIREESEKFDEQISEEELQDIEVEIEDKAEVNRKETTKAQLETIESGKAKKKVNKNHTKRNFILAIIGLIGLIAVITIALSGM